VFVYKLTSAGQWSVTTREASSKVVAGTGLSSTYSGTTLTLNVDSSTIPSRADLATVAISGDYDDLTDKPDLTLKADASSVYTKSEIDAMIGTINTELSNI